MADDTEIERMLDEKMQDNEPTNKQQNGDKEKKHKKHKHHKHHKSHKNEKKHDRKRSRSPINDRRRRSPTPPTLPSGKRRDVNSELHQLAQTLNRNRQSKQSASSLKANRREKSPELTPEERDLRTVFCMQLAAMIRPRDLEEFFSRVGKVRDVRLITDPRTRRSKGVAYVEFRDLACVQAGLALSGEKLLGIPIIVKPSNAEKNRLAAQAAAATASQNALMANGIAALSGSIIPTHGPMKLYVGSLHFNITEDMLRGIFEPFGRIENITLMKDPESNRSRGYGFIQFAHAEDAKRAMENLNGFELAGRPMKVGHVTERPGEMAGSSGTSFPNYTSEMSSSFASASNLDSDDLDHRGISLGATGRLALMAKLSEGSGLQMPKHAIDALQAAHMQKAGSQHVRIPEPPNPQQLATVTAVGTQCFMLSNMFNPTTEANRNPNWAQEIRDDVIEECNKHGGVVHIYVDEKSSDGNVYVKCSTIASAINAVNSLHGRFFSGRTVVGNYIPTQSYHKLFPAASTATALLTSSYE
jgi:RNA-binding protein 39